MNESTCTIAKQITNIALLGGEGSRQKWLTRHDQHERAKPAVPIFGKYRIVDFLLSNLVNSDCTNVTALLQFGAQPLTKYLAKAWVNELEIDYASPTRMIKGNEYLGTADAVRQVSWQLRHKKSKLTGVWAGDHVTKFDVNPFVQSHLDLSSKFTIAVMPVPIEKASQFGIVVVDESGKVIDFQEKPGSAENSSVIPQTIPGNSKMVLASLGNYIVDREYLVETLHAYPDLHDFGKDIIPAIIGSGDVYAHDISSIVLPGGENFFWADVGALKDYFDIHMQMLNPVPPVNLKNDLWPVLFLGDHHMGARSIGNQNSFSSSVATGGCEYEGSNIDYTWLSRNVDIRYSNIEQCILGDNVRVEKGCDLHRVIIDKNNHIPAGTVIGRDYDEDKARGFYVDRESRIVIVPKYYDFAVSA